MTSIHHLLVKFPTSNGVRQVQVCQSDARECYNNSLRATGKDKKPEQALVVSEQRLASSGPMSEDLDPRQLEDKLKTRPVEGLVEVAVSEQEPTCVLKLGENLSHELKEELTHFLKANLDVFGWTHEDMVGIHPDIMCHWLNISPDFKPIRQKRRAMDAERYKALKDEVDKLLDICLIRESFYPSWLANPVPIKKLNDKWRTCVDFTDLNKAYPKDSFLLPRID